MSDNRAFLAAQRLEQAQAIHDDEPEAALELLRGINPAELASARHGEFAFLMNHVPGEKFGRWEEALAAQQAIVDIGTMTVALWRHAAVAAFLAGDTVRTQLWRDALAAEARAQPGQVQALIVLTAASFTVPGQNAALAGRDALRAVQALPGAPLDPGLDALFASAANNLASHIVERPLDDLRHPDLRAALDLCALLALQCWLRAGTWVHHERAHYLCALAANALCDGERGALQARRGLALIDAHDTEHEQNVDRAFLELELAQGLWLTGARGAAEAEGRSQALAQDFRKESLRKWYAERRQRNAELLSHHRRRE